MAKKNDALMRKALETALPEKRDAIEATLKKAVYLSIEKVDELRKLCIVTADKKEFHAMMYPCLEDGSAVDWSRDKLFAGNGGSVDAAIADVGEAVLGIEDADYPAGSEVLVKSGRMEFVGLEGRIYEILDLNEPQRVFGHRYHVRFYDKNSDFGMGYIGANSYRQSQLELISKPQEASNGG